MQITNSSPTQIIEDPAQPDPEKLSSAEIRMCFPGQVTLTSNNQSITLRDAPMIGLLLQLLELWKRLHAGERSPEVVDFYGEYQLRLRHEGHAVVLENEWSGEAIRMPNHVFAKELRKWSRSLFEEVETRHSSIRLNPNYLNLKVCALD